MHVSNKAGTLDSPDAACAPELRAVLAMHARPLEMQPVNTHPQPSTVKDRTHLR